MTLPNAKLTKDESAKLRTVFDFLADLYKEDGFAESRLAKEQPHFYTMVTSLLATDMLSTIDVATLRRKIKSVSASINLGTQSDAKAYLKTVERQTTDTSQREQRQSLFVKMVKAA